MYLTYEEYTNMGGALDEPTFDRLAFKVGKIIDDMTANRVKKMKEVPEAVKRCIFELISQENLFEENMKSASITAQASGGKMIASFSTDGYSETYGGSSVDYGTYLKTMRESLNTLERQTIHDMLAYEYDDKKTKLLYRGVV